MASRKSAGDDLPDDLAQVMKAWSNLPAPIKTAIKALIDSSMTAGE